MGNTERSANRGARLLDIMLESVVVYDLSFGFDSRRSASV